MNYEHINAIMAASGTRKCATHGDKVLRTQTCFAYVSDTPADGEDYKPLRDLWIGEESHSADLPVLAVGDCIKEHRKFNRRFGENAYINEAYYRALNTEGCEWRGVDREDSTLHVLVNGELTAIVRTVKYVHWEQCEAIDAEVFCEFACEKNGMYLETVEHIRERLQTLEEDADEVQEKIDDLEADLKMQRDAIHKLREAIEARQNAEKVEVAK